MQIREIPQKLIRQIKKLVKEIQGQSNMEGVEAGGMRARRPESSPVLTSYMTLNRVPDPSFLSSGSVNHG